MIPAFLIGILFGFFGSMPVAGPTAIVLVSKGLDSHKRAGIYIAAGAAVAEAGYAFMAFWGITAVLRNYPFLLPASRFAGAILLLLLGLYFSLRKPKPPSETAKLAEAKQAGAGNLLFGFSLTALNPTLLVTWTAAVGVAHATGLLRVHESDAFPFAGGVILGIVGWFALFLEMLSRFRSRVSPATVNGIIRWMGVLLVVVGAGLIVRSIIRWS